MATTDEIEKERRQKREEDLRAQAKRNEEERQLKKAERKVEEAKKAKEKERDDEMRKELDAATNPNGDGGEPKKQNNKKQAAPLPVLRRPVGGPSFHEGAPLTKPTTQKQKSGGDPFQNNNNDSSKLKRPF